jgi:hypothetical protein
MLQSESWDGPNGQSGTRDPLSACISCTYVEYRASAELLRATRLGVLAKGAGWLINWPGRSGDEYIEIALGVGVWQQSQLDTDRFMTNIGVEFTILPLRQVL